MAKAIMNQSEETFLIMELRYVVLRQILFSAMIFFKIKNNPELPKGCTCGASQGALGRRNTESELKYPTDVVFLPFHLAIFHRSLL